MGFGGGEGGTESAHSSVFFHPLFIVDYDRLTIVFLRRDISLFLELFQSVERILFYFFLC